MDERVRANWRRIYQALLEAGKTDCALFRRAALIVAGHADPGPGF